MQRLCCSTQRVQLGDTGRGLSARATDSPQGKRAVSGHCHASHFVMALTIVLSPGAAPPYLRGEHSAWQEPAEGLGGGSRGGPAALTAAWLRCRRPWRQPRSGGRCGCAGAGRPPSGRARRAAGTAAPSPPWWQRGEEDKMGVPIRAHHTGGAAHLLQQQVSQRREELGRGCWRGPGAHPLLDGCGAEG